MAMSHRYRDNADDPDKSEHFVSVKRLESCGEQEAVSEVGFFGNQNTMCRSTAPRWHHTIEMLKRYFGNWSVEL
jgi:hypothetical protein